MSGTKQIKIDEVYSLAHFSHLCLNRKTPGTSASPFASNNNNGNNNMAPFCYSSFKNLQADDKAFEKICPAYTSHAMQHHNFKWHFITVHSKICSQLKQSNRKKNRLAVCQNEMETRAIHTNYNSMSTA
jgi:hypothetical protein